MPELLPLKSLEGFRNNLPRTLVMYFTSHKRNLAINIGGSKIDAVY